MKKVIAMISLSALLLGACSESNAPAGQGTASPVTGTTSADSAPPASPPTTTQPSSHPADSPTTTPASAANTPSHPSAVSEPAALTEQDIAASELLRPDWTGEQLEASGFKRQGHERNGRMTYSNGSQTYTYMALFGRRVLTEAEVTGDAAGPRGIHVGESLQDVLARFPQQSDWRNNAGGVVYGSFTPGAEAGTTRLTGYVVTGKNGEKELVLHTEQAFPELHVYFQGDVATRYAIVMIDADYWFNLQYDLLRAGMSADTLRGIEATARLPLKFATTIEAGRLKHTVQLQQIPMEGHALLFTQHVGQTVGIVNTRDGRETFVIAEGGLWQIDSATHRPRKISSDTFNGHSYDELVKASMAKYDENYISWIGGGILSPDDSTLIYGANKLDWNARGNALFAFDLAAHEERMIVSSKTYTYDVIGWLNEGAVVALKYRDAENHVVMVGLDGKETELHLAKDAREIHAVSDNLIAYYAAQPGGAGEFHIAKVSPAGTLQDQASVPVDGTSRMRASNWGFNPGHTDFAFIYVHDGEPYSRYVKVVDLKSGEVTDVKPLQDAANASPQLIDFLWADDNTLIIDQEDGTASDQTFKWTYSMTDAS